MVSVAYERLLILSGLFSLSTRGVTLRASEDCDSTLLDVDIHAKIKSYNDPQLLCLAVTRWSPDLVIIPLLPYSKGFVRVPHQVRKVASPTVSKAFATTEIPTVSRARFSWNTWTMNCDHVSNEFILGRGWLRPGEGNSR